MNENGMKRRTLNNLPVILDNQVQTEAKNINLSVNDLYIDIIKDYYSKKLESEMSINLNSDLKEILLEVMKNQIYMIELLEDQQKIIDDLSYIKKKLNGADFNILVALHMLADISEEKAVTTASMKDLRNHINDHYQSAVNRSKHYLANKREF